MVARIVGYWEYGNALKNLDRLVGMLNEGELEAVSRMVAEKDEFTVFVNIAGTLPQGPTSFEFDPNDDFERRGLNWIMAFARVEFGSMLAAFTDAADPFATASPTAYDSESFFVMLDDATRTHYWSLINDPDLPLALKSHISNPNVLAYTRRFTLARQLLRTTVRAGIGTYTPLQLRELSSWKEGLDRYHGRFIQKIRAFLVAQNAQSTTSTSSTSSSAPYLDGCNLQLAAFRRESAAGTAEVQPITPSSK